MRGLCSNLFLALGLEEEALALKFAARLGFRMKWEVLGW